MRGTWEFDVQDKFALVRFVGDQDVPVTFLHAAELADVLDAAGIASEATSVVVLLGGEGAFLPDLDREEIDRRLDGQQVEGDPQSWQRVMSSLESLPQPTIAALDGAARGAAALVALGCTLRLASERALLGPIETTLGVVGTDTAPYLVPLVGPSIASELLLTGRELTAATAHQLGLVNEVLETQAFGGRVLDWCRRIASQPASTVFATKRVIADQGTVTRAALVDAQPAGGPGPAQPLGALRSQCGCGPSPADPTPDFAVGP